MTETEPDPGGLVEELIDRGYAVRKRNNTEIDVWGNDEMHSPGRFVAVVRQYGYCIPYVKAPTDTGFDIHVSLLPAKFYWGDGDQG